MIPRPSIASRAVLAVSLMIGFYVLALVLAMGLLYIPYAEVVILGRINLQITLFSLLGAAAIIWAVVPRGDRFQAPGPMLSAQLQPRLFGEIEAVAQAVGQAMPAEVYLVSDINAWVAQRGGVMGMGGRRVMGLGLPLMRVLSVEQFRAVLAHEFGHFYGGDTQLGPWIYKTRSAIVRTVRSLSGRGGGASLLRAPFVWYGNFFLRITHAISRRQEFVADELAASTMGARALIEGLRAVHGAGPAYQLFWKHECMPVLNAGFRPPLVEGFSRFVATPAIVEAMAKHIDQQLLKKESEPHDTHPALAERIAALKEIADHEILDTKNAPERADGLLEGVEELEQQLFRILAGAERAARLQTLPWSETGEKVYLPIWIALAKVNADALTGVMPEALPEIALARKAFGQRLVDRNKTKPSERSTEGFAGAVVGAALAVGLVRQGWQIETLPGSAVALRRDPDAIEVFDVVDGLAAGRISAGAWIETCRRLGLAGMDLSKVT